VALIDDVKQTLRITNSAYNIEIADLILAAKADLGICGLLTITETDALIKRAIITYCKAEFGMSNDDSEKYRKSYEMLRNHLSLSLDYAFWAVAFTVVDELAVAIYGANVIFNGEEKLTDEDGIAIFYTRTGNNFEYTAEHEDYDDYLDADDELYKTDVIANTEIDIVMTGV